VTEVFNGEGPEKLPRIGSSDPNGVKTTYPRVSETAQPCSATLGRGEETNINPERVAQDVDHCGTLSGFGGFV